MYDQERPSAYYSLVTKLNFTLRMIINKLIISDDLHRLGKMD